MKGWKSASLKPVEKMFGSSSVGGPSQREFSTAFAFLFAVSMAASSGVASPGFLCSSVVSMIYDAAGVVGGQYGLDRRQSNPPKEVPGRTAVVRI